MLFAFTALQKLSDKNIMFWVFAKMRSLTRRWFVLTLLNSINISMYPIPVIRQFLHTKSHVAKCQIYRHVMYVIAIEFGQKC